MPTAFAYWNGQLLPAEQMRLSPADAGFVYGATVTDLVRTFNRRLFRWSAHLTRFQASCAALGVPLPSADELTTVATELIARNGPTVPAECELLLVLFATPGPLGRYAGVPGQDGPPTLGMHTLPLDPTRFGTLLTHGAKLVASRQTWPASTLAPQLKHRSRLPWWLAEQAARAAGALPLFVNEQNQWTETPTANFLLVRGGVVYSPPRTQILHGVSLDVVEELCADLGIAFRERPLPIDEPGDEALLTNTSYCVAGVAELAGRRLEWPGPIYTRLRAGWPAG